MNDPGRSRRHRVSALISTKAESHLNKRVRRYGDISRLVKEALLGVDLLTVAVEQRPKVRGVVKSDLRPRQVMLEADLHEALKVAAAQRKISVNLLIDAAVNAHFDAKSGKSSTHPGSS